MLLLFLSVPAPSLPLNSSFLTNRSSKHAIGSSFVPIFWLHGNFGSEKLASFYDVEESAKVTILAIGIKERNKLYIEGKEVQL